MKNAKHNSGIGGLLLVAAFAMVTAGFAPMAQADPPVMVKAGADIHVWVDDTRTVYPSYDDVTISIHASRGCYATVFVIDTYGFIHVIHPFSPYDSAWIGGGRTYRFSGHELGLDLLGGRGIAHVFAVSSPYPFDFSPYGESIFAGGYGYRIYGDPYVAGRQLYVSLLPVGYRWNDMRVGFARFYVREWVRYPAYLCYGYHGGTVHVRVGDSCRQCYRVYDQYRTHVNDPYVALRPAPARYKDKVARAGNNRTSTRIKRTERVFKQRITAGRVKSPEARPVTRSARNAKIISAKRTDTKANNTRMSPRVTKTRATGAKRQTTVVKRTSKTTGVDNKTGKAGKTRSVKGSGKNASKNKKNYGKGQVSR